MLNEVFPLKLVRFSNNSGNQKTITQALMYKSGFSKNKEIISLVSVNRLNEENNFHMSKEVLLLMENINFKVISIKSYNNRINRNMFIKLWGNNDLKSSIKHSYNDSEKLFLLFDTVHLVKRIRNNCLSKVHRTSYFPHPHNYIEILKTFFTGLENIYNEGKDAVLKSAPKWTDKCLHPTSIKKQNLVLELEIFDNTNSVSLKPFGDKLTLCLQNYLSRNCFTSIIIFFNIWRYTGIFK